MEERVSKKGLHYQTYQLPSMLIFYLLSGYHLGLLSGCLVNILPVRIHVCKLHLAEFCERGVVLECGSTSDQRSL